jgi:hypothetical protein
MDVSQQSLKGLTRIGLAAMAALFVLALLFWRQRVLFADAAYIAFHIVNYKNWAIQEQRWGSFISQLFPYLGQKLHLSLKTLLIGYGIGFNLFYLSVNAVLIYVLKQYRLAILMALYYFLFFSQAFIWINEIQQGLAWLFLLFGIVLYLGDKQKRTLQLVISFLILGTLTLFTHFVLLIPFVYLWVYFILEKKNWPFSKTLSIVLSCLPVVIIGLKFFGTHSAYDAERLRGVTHLSIKDVIESFTTAVVKMFLYRCVTNYWLGGIVFFIGIVRLIQDKEKKLVTWTCLSAIGYVIIMGLTYSALDKTTLLLHIESEWSCMAIIVATPFVFAVLPRMTLSKAGCLLTAIFAIRLGYIISFLPPFTERLNLNEQILTQMRKKGVKKLAIYNDDQLISAEKLFWALPEETLLMSAMDGDKPQLTFLYVNPNDKHTIEQLNNAKGFFDSYANVPAGEMNKQYFQVDSAHGYQVMTYAELLK